MKTIEKKKAERGVDHLGFVTSEWRRLDYIAYLYETVVKQEFIRYHDGMGNDVLKTVYAIVIDTVSETAEVYNMNLNPYENRFRVASQVLADELSKVMNTNETRDYIIDKMNKQKIYDRKRSLVIEYSRRLSKESADKILEMVLNGATPTELQVKQREELVQRANLVAMTETNRVINGALVASWIVGFQKPQVIKKIKPFHQIDMFQELVGGDYSDDFPPSLAREWVTRKDERVCKYCEPLDGLLADFAEPFITQYGEFDFPPAHPRCRCFQVLDGVVL